MVVREWGEIRQLYESCRPRIPTTGLAARSIQAIMAFYLLVMALTGFMMVRPNALSVGGVATPYLLIGLVLIAMLGGGALWPLIERAGAGKYKALYSAHRIKHYPWWQRRLYLHYALFLCALTDRPAPVSREMLTRLRSFADIAGRPTMPESRLMQPAFIVPYIVLLNTLIVEILKRAELLEGRKGIIVLTFAVLGLIGLWYVLWTVWQMRMINTGRFSERRLQRFLQWAEYDLEEAQRLRTQSPHTGLPGLSES